MDALLRSRIAVTTAALAALVAACGPPSRRASDGTVIRTVREVEIEGNEALSDERIEDGLATRERTGLIRRRYSDVDAFDLERDRARIEAYYRRHGFFRARVTAVRVNEVGDERADVVFEVAEGPAGKVRVLEIEGAPDHEGLRAGDLRRLSRLRTERRFSYEDFQDSKWRIRDALVAAGYARASVTGTAEVDRTSLDVRIVLRVDPGPANVFGETRVIGTVVVPESSVRARLAWKPGDAFDPRKLAETRRRLLGLGRFSTVRLDLDGPRDRPRADVVVTLTEAPRNELRLGGGIGIDTANYLVRGRAGYKRHGVFDPLNTLSIDLRPAYAFVRGVSDTVSSGFVGEATATLVREDLWVPRLRGTASVAYTQQQLEAFSSLGTRLGLGLARGFLSERLRIGAGWRYLLLKVDVDRLLDDEPATRDRLVGENPYGLGYFEQTVAYDGRDNLLDARRGVYAEVRVEESGPYAASEFRYVKVTPEVRGYLPLGTERLILAARGRLGRTLMGTLPLTQRYYAGGASSQRGFAQRRLSPVVGDVAVEAAGIGGDSLIETNVEARVDVKRLGGEWLGVVFFLDGADAVDTADGGEVDVTNLHWAAGFGLRYNTIVGPIRFDLGFRLNRKDELEPDSSYAFHFSLGEAF